MSFMRAFQSLREVFPQVDGRILKAVAIEHYKDVDAAVEFILSEVLPFISGPPEALPSLHGTPEIKFPSADAELKDLGFVSSSGAEETALSFFPGSKSAACEHTPGAVSAVQISATLSDTSPSMDEATSTKFSGLRSVACDSAPGTDHASAAFPIKTHHLGEADASLFSETRPEACEIAPGAAFHGKSVYMEEPAGGAAQLNNFPSRHEQVVKEPYASLQSESTLLATENAIVTEPAGGAAQLNNLTSSYEEAVKEQYASVPSELVLLATENALVSEPFHVKAPNLDDSFADDLSPVHSGNDSEIQSCFSAEEAMSREKHLLGSCQGSFAATSFVMTEDANVVWTSALHSNIREFCQLECNDIVSSVSTSCQQFTPPATEEITVSVEHGVSEENSTKSPGSQYEELEHGVAEENNTKSSSSKYEEEHSKSSAKKGDDEMDFDTETGVVDFLNNLATIATRSGQVVSIDFLEDFIADAKNNKKTLAAAMESVVCMMKEVELHEREATQAKEEASMAGLDVLAKVEDLKRMLSHANEANDMHAGEVYGEKSILATEARELQSRLLSLSDERDRSLLIINEMHQTLKARLAAADAERAAAEEEKMEKDKMAREALAEQEFIMNKVVQESKKLHQEAEENAKLREFLMDRGRIVDVLQGEIGVICEDVMSLKERVDGRVPLSKSLASSLTSRSLASSSSSSSHKSMLSYRVPDLLADSTEGASQEFPGNQQPEDDPKSRWKSVDAGNSDGKAASSSDDDWDLVVEEGDPTHLGDIMIE